MNTSCAAPSMRETQLEKRVNNLCFIIQNKEFLIQMVSNILYENTELACRYFARGFASFPAAETQHEKCVRNLLYLAAGRIFSHPDALNSLLEIYTCCQIFIFQNISFNSASTSAWHKLRRSRADIPELPAQRSHSQPTINRANVNFP